MVSFVIIIIGRTIGGFDIDTYILPSPFAEIDISQADSPKYKERGSVI